MIGVTYDCEPTLTDLQVIEFCQKGFLILKSVVPDEINRRTVSFLDEHASSGQPVELLDADWFVEGVIKHPQAAGAVRSLLGKNFKLPVYIGNHRKQCPLTRICGWHRDGGAMIAPQLDFLQVFYYPQDTPKEMGPTELVPSTHFLRGSCRFMQHYGSIRKAVSTAGPAGTIFIAHYSILHRATTATASGVRNLVNYPYWRTAAPQRDWVVEPELDFGQVKFSPDISVHQGDWDALAPARMFHWLCGLGEDFEFKGGQAWPIHAGFSKLRVEGVPPGLARLRKIPARE